MEELKDSKDEYSWAYVSRDVLLETTVDDMNVEVERHVNNLKARLTKRQDTHRNYKYHIFAQFKNKNGQKLAFYPQDIFQRQFDAVIAACYVFKFHSSSLCNPVFGLFLRLKGYAPKNRMVRVLVEFINVLTAANGYGIQILIPKLNQYTSIQSYIESIYCTEDNLLYNYADVKDAVSHTRPTQIFQITHTALQKLTTVMKNSTQMILKNIIAFPNYYPTTHIACILRMSPENYKEYMRLNTLDSIVYNLCQDAYNAGLYDYQFDWQQAQQLMEPTTRRSLINRFVDDNVKKEVHQLLKDQFNVPYVHPHPYSQLLRSNLITLNPFDALVLDPSFLFPLMMCARWFAKVCMRQLDKVTSNNANLMLYGASGTGKSFIIGIISSCIPAYKYLVNSKFQSPQLLSSALMIIDEFNTRKLVENIYKYLLDIRYSVKIDFKNMHPDDATCDVPTILSTNDDVLTVLNGMANDVKHRVNQESINAALRRLYLVPLKSEMFDKKHGKISNGHQYYKYLWYYNESFTQEVDKLPRLFNFIVGFGLFQQDISYFLLNPHLYSYFQKLVGDFKQTLFGAFYLQNKQFVDQLMLDVEKVQTTLDVNDSEYHVAVQVGVNKFAERIRYFVTEMSEDIKDLNSDIMSDDSAPWHLRIYYYKKHFDMVEKIFYATAKGEEKLNAEIKVFINDVNIQPYIIDSTSCDEEDDGAMPVPESPQTLREVKRTSIEKYEDDSISNSSELFDLGEPTFVHPEEGFRILGKRKKRYESKFAYDSNDDLY